MRRTRNVLFVAMLATLMVGMTAAGAIAGSSNGLGRIPTGISSLDSPAITLDAAGDAETGQVFTFTVGEATTITRVNLTLPAGITVTDADVTGGTCSSGSVITYAGNQALVTGVSCGQSATLAITVDFTSGVMIAGTYSVSAEYKAEPAKRVKPTGTNMWRVFGDDVITVA